MDIPLSALIPFMLTVIYGLLILSLFGIGATRAPAVTERQPSNFFRSSQFMIAQDAIPRPPRWRHFAAPNDHYHLIVTTDIDGAAKQSTANLFASTVDRCQPVWTRVLPQEYGPRLALVSNTGHTLMVDEWINVASPYAIMVFDTSGDLLAQHGFDDIVARTGRTRADVVAQAEQGFWLAGDPVLQPTGEVFMPTAGGRLTIQINDGEMGFQRF